MPIKIKPKAIEIIPPDSSCIILFNPSPTKVKPKRDGNTKIIYKNCGSDDNILIELLSLSF